MDGEGITYVDREGNGGMGYALLLRAVQEEWNSGNVVYDPFPVPSGLCGELVGKLMRIPEVARVCADLTPKFGLADRVAPGATIEYA